MVLLLAFAAALVGLALAAVAALAPQTGVEGTLGAYLTLLGALAVVLATGILKFASASSLVRRLLFGAAVLSAVLTAVAGWFLMQNGVVAALLVSLVAVLWASLVPERKVAL